jgi:hypothetical protein
MSLKLMTRARSAPAREPETDSPEDIAEMMAEAARVDAMFQSGAISTLLPYAISLDTLQAIKSGHDADADEKTPEEL